MFLIYFLLDRFSDVIQAAFLKLFYIVAVCHLLFWFS